MELQYELMKHGSLLLQYCSTECVRAHCGRANSFMGKNRFRQALQLQPTEGCTALLGAPRAALTTGQMGPKISSQQKYSGLYGIECKQSLKHKSSKHSAHPEHPKQSQIYRLNHIGVLLKFHLNLHMPLYFLNQSCISFVTLCPEISLKQVPLLF